MSEKNSFEKSPEQTPNLEKVRTFFGELNIGEYKETRTIEDENGLCLFEVKTLPDSLGGENEYTYIRKGTHKGGQSAETVIHVTYYKDDMPVGGTSVANYIDGQWIKC
jgi:hypothetical protein